MTAQAAPRSDWAKPAFLALSCVGFVSSAHAATAIPANDTDATDAEHTVTVTGQRQEQSENIKLTKPVIDTPRSITVLGEQLIRDTGSQNLVDALRRALDAIESRV